MAETLIAVEGVSHFYGRGELRKRILHQVTTRVEAGEIVILTGPSGSGKTTLLTLIGALRATQEGSVRVLGHELRNASESTLVGVRRRIGFIFQLHNLLDALTVTQNVMMGLHGVGGMSKRAAAERAREMLASVGLERRADHLPAQLSGGQKQRVAIARALAARPRIILADEPTASLDRQSGRDAVERIHELAKRQGAAVVLVTHDNRILDIADRIVHLEEGRLSSYADAVRTSTRQLLGTLAKAERGGDGSRQLEAMAAPDFFRFLEQLTAESQQVLEAMALAADGAFETMLEHVLRTVTGKVGQLLKAERASLLLADDARGELWSLVTTQEEGGERFEIRMPATAGIAGHVYRTGECVNTPDAYQHPSFNPEVDRRSGLRTRSLLCVPLLSHAQRPFAVMTLLNKQGGDAFDDEDTRRLTALAGSVAVVLQTWHEASRVRHARGNQSPEPCEGSR
jgi:putative ABC transport system ATP-binding protein